MNEVKRMCYAKIIDYYVTANAVFYQLSVKLDLAPILKHPLNQGETIELAIAHWDSEQHWLADWKNNTPFEGFYPGCEVAFEINSSTYYNSVKHKNTIKSVRNINISSITKIR